MTKGIVKTYKCDPELNCDLEQEKLFAILQRYLGAVARSSLTILRLISDIISAQKE